jgi:hypothetical protein
MPDKWAQYAQPQTAAPAADKWAQYAQPESGGDSLTDNPNAEGTYQMLSPDKKTLIGVPYSKNDTAINAGYSFATPEERERFIKDYAYDPRVRGAAAKFASENADPVLSAGAGAVKGALKTATGAAHLVGAPVPQTLNDLASAPGTNLAETAGETAEGIAEFIMGDEALKGLSYADRLKQTSIVMKAIEKSPSLARIVTNGLRQGVVAGTQAGLKTGGDVNSALIAGGVGAAGSVVPEVLGAGVGAGTKTIVNRIQRPLAEQAEADKTILQGARDVAARNLEEVNESRATPPIDSSRTLPSSNGPYEFRLQGPPTTETTEGEMLVPARKKQIGTTVEARSNPDTFDRAQALEPYGITMQEEGVPVESTAEPLREPGSEGETNSRNVRKVPRYQSLTGIKPGVEPQTSTIGGGGEIRTNDPAIAKQHIATLNEAISSPDFEALNPKQQEQILAARQDAQQQMAGYHRATMEQYNGHNVPNFEPVDIRQAVQRVGSFPEAVDQINNAYKEVYNRLDDVTGGDFKAVQNAQKNAWRDYINAEGTEARAVAARKVATANDDMASLLQGLQGIVSPSDLAGANQAYKNSLTVENLSHVVERSLEGTWRDKSRALNGRVLMNGLKNLYESAGSGTAGRAAVERVIGSDTLDNLENIAKLNSTAEGRSKMNYLIRKAVAYTAGAALGGAAHGIAHAPYGISLGMGGATYYGTEALLTKMATDPKIGNFFVHAAENSGRVIPKTLVPILSSIVSESLASDEQWRKTKTQESTMASPDPRGMVEPGNLDIRNRPTIQNADGSHSSEYSVSFEDDKGREVLVPTIVDGKFLTPDGKKPPEGSAEEKAMFNRAWQHYQQTGENLGKFDNPENADAYAQILHSRGERTQ